MGAKSHLLINVTGKNILSSEHFYPIYIAEEGNTA